MKDPAFLMYSKDWITGTQFMSMEERGIYITLLMAQHQNGHLDTKRLGFILGFSWDTVSVIVKEKFTTDPQGLIFNERLEVEIEKRASFLTKQTENGSKGGRPKKPKENPDHNPNTNPKETMRVANAIVNEDVIEEEVKEGLETIRSLTDESQQVLEALMEKFGISEMNDYPIFTKLHSFVSVLQSRNEIGKLIKQAKAYWLYKETSGDKTHGPLKFIGTIEKHYQDGGWCAENWVHKLNNFKENGKSNSKDADQRNSDREAELAHLMAEKFGT